jgi:hypothetical protein
MIIGLQMIGLRTRGPHAPAITSFVLRRPSIAESYGADGWP